MTLTERQREILLLLAKGYTLEETGEKLYLSESAVKNHRTAALKRLGVKRTIQGVIKLIKTGELSLDEI